MAKLRILIAEDNPVNQEGGGGGLPVAKKLGYVAEVVENGRLVLEAM